MKSLKLSTKISILAGAALVVSAIALGIVAVRISTSEITELITENLETTEYGVTDTLEIRKEATQYATLVLADKTRLATALINNDFETANKLTTDQLKTLDVDMLFVTDEDGIVIAGGKTGADLSKSEAVKDALAGQISYAYEATEITEYGLLVSYPIKSNGKVVGVVVSGYSLTNGDFVNNVKTNFKVECTIFEDDVRKSTTLGANFVGTRLDNQTIVNQVLRNGQTYIGSNTISGVQYMSIYVPLRNGDGNVTGMLFTAKPRDAIVNATNKMIRTIVPIIIALVIGIVLVVIFFLRSLLKPLQGVKETLDDISSGDADLTK